MIDWSARARAQLAKLASAGSDETDETRVPSVSSVWSEGFQRNRAEVSSVSSAPSVRPADGARSVAQRMPQATNDGRMGAEHGPLQHTGNPYLTAAQGDECHFGGWDDREINLFTARAVRFAAIGRKDAEHLAERLALRDRQADDRRMCVECQELERTGRCAAARRGGIAGTDRRMEPVQNILMRCEAFRIAVSTHENRGGP